jgi:putative inorganic carbon (hco3(-)) transporter
VAGVIALLGLAMGATVAGLPAPLAIAALAVVLLVGAVIYRPAVGLAALAFVYPFDLSIRAGPVKWSLGAILLGILFLLWAGQQILRSAPKRQRTPLDLQVSLFAVATVISLLSLLGPSADSDQQIVGLLKAAGGFALFILAVQWLQERRDLWLVVGSVLLTGLIQAAMTVFPMITGARDVSELTRASGMTVDGNLFAGFLVLVAPLVLVAALNIGRRPGFLFVGGAAILLCGAALAATLSRSGWLGMLAAVGTLAVVLPEHRRRIAILTAGSLLILLVAGLAGPIADRLQAAEGSAGTLLGRLPIWWAALQMFAQHPAFGVGLQNFGGVVKSYNPSLDVNHAHNLFLNVAAERGILGLLTFSGLVVVLFQTLHGALVHARRTSDRMLAGGLIASFVAFLVHSIFDVSYYDYRILLLFWILLGVAAVLPRVFTPANA